MINKNTGWATAKAKKNLQQTKNQASQGQYKKLKSMYNKAIDGKVKVLNAQQIASKAINTKANSTDIDVWNKMDKILKKTRHVPFMYRTENSWDKPSLQEDKKHGAKENDTYYVSLARAGQIAKKFRKQRKTLHGNYREHPKQFYNMQQQFENKLQGIDYEQTYREMKSWYHKAHQRVNKTGSGKKGFRKLISHKYHTKNIDKLINRDKKFLKSMGKHSRNQRILTAVKASSIAIGASNRNIIKSIHKPNFKGIGKNIKNTLAQDFKKPNYQAIGKNIKHGVKGLFNKFTGVAKKSGKIVADRLTKLGERLNQNHKFNIASQYVTHVYDKGINSANELMDKIGMPKVGTNARKPKHMERHTRFAYKLSPHKHEIKHEMHKNMQRTQHLEMGPTI